MTKPLSIVIITYNRRDFLEKCMYCVCETGNAENYDLYIWDNASTDDTADFLASYKKWNFIKPMRSKVNIGTEASNKLVEIIETPFIMTLEPDAWICTKGWDEAILDCFKQDDKLGSLHLLTFLDERSQYGVTWQGTNYDTLSKPRFRCESILGMDIPADICSCLEKGLTDEKEKGRIKIVGEHSILLRGHFIPCGGTGVWRRDLIKNYLWKSHSGLISDINGEWGEHIAQQGYYSGIIYKYFAYHAAIAPWFHLEREYEYWIKKADLAPVIYNRSSEVEWSWYKQAKEWSGWGSGIPDTEDVLKECAQKS